MAKISASGQKLKRGLGKNNFCPRAGGFWVCQPAEGGLATKILRRDSL